MVLRRKSVVKEWGISYILILFLPLIAAFVNYGYNARVIEKEIVQAHGLILDNLKDNIDRLLDKEREMFSNFYHTEDFRKLNSFAEADTGFYKITYDFQTQVSKYNAGMEEMDYWLYMEDKDYLLSGSIGDKSGNVYNSQKLRTENLPEYEAWESFLRSDYTNEYMIYDGLLKYKDELQIVYANTYRYYSQRKSNVFITVPVSSVEKMTQSLPEDSLFVLCFENEIPERSSVLTVGAQGCVPLPEEDLDQYIRREGVFELPDYVVLSTLSGHNGVHCALLIPRDVFWKESQRIRGVHLMVLLVTLLLGLCLIVLLLRRNSAPMFRLLKKMDGYEEHSGDKGMESGNEFEKIEGVYSRVQRENSRMRKTIQKQEEELTGSYLLSLLKERRTLENSLEDAKRLGIPFDSDHFVLVSFYVPLQESGEMEYDELSFFIVDNVLSELLEKETFYRIEEGRFLHYLFCVSGKNIFRWKENLLGSLESVYDFIKEKCGLDIPVVVSGAEDSLRQAGVLYQKVMEAFEYQKIVGENGVFNAEEFLAPAEENHVGPYQRMLTQALENRQPKQARKVVCQLFEDWEKLPFAALRFQVLEVFLTAAESYNMYITDPVKRMQILPWLDTILNAENVQTMREQFLEMLDFVCARISGQWEVETGGIVADIREYVEENYMDVSLNINSIAQAMDRNPKYISRVYKEETGEGILDYINTLRIRKAQEILLTQNRSMEEVAEMVGYASIRTFRRNFIKITGMLPSSYMENN